MFSEYRRHSECLSAMLHVACCLSGRLLLSTSRCCACLAMWDESASDLPAEFCVCRV